MPSDNRPLAEVSAAMRGNRARDTRPELIVRRLLHRMGYRYRLHRRDLPGTPDIVFPSRKAVIFVHGCFWHQHPDPACKIARMPKSRLGFWGPKMAANRERDERDLAALERLGWKTLVVWECGLRDATRLRESLVQFLEGAA